MKLVVAFLLASVAALAEPLTVGNLTTITDQYGILRPVITNNTANARFFDSSQPLFWQVTQTFADGSTASYGDVYFGTLLAGQSLTVPVALNAPWIGATSWTFTFLPTEMFRLSGPTGWRPIFQLAGVSTWYYAQNNGLTGSISSAGPVGPVRVADVIPNCWNDPVFPGCNSGPPPGQTQGQASIQGLAGVPEPGTWAMLLGGVALVGVRRLRR